jgi:UDP-glucose 4-epimerase
MIADVSLNFTTKFISLRYFNPVGAHPTALLGEMQKGKPENLVPAITQFASGIIPDFYIHGNDYPTRDGTCIRDYVHVCDIAHAHALALQHLIANKNEPAHRIINLGSGKGVSVLEAVRAFENIAGLKINYKIGPRREGDVIQIYADYTLAKQILGWQPKYTIEDMMRTAWQWQQKLTAISKSNQN